MVERPATASSLRSDQAFDPRPLQQSHDALRSSPSDASLPSYPVRVGQSLDNTRGAVWPPSALALQEPLTTHNDSAMPSRGLRIKCTVGRVNPLARAMHSGAPLHQGAGSAIAQGFERHGVETQSPFARGFLGARFMLPPATDEVRPTQTLHTVCRPSVWPMTHACA
jgi:hypothetical protein